MSLTQQQIQRLRREHHPQPSTKPPCRGNARAPITAILHLADNGHTQTAIATPARCQPAMRQPRTHQSQKGRPLMYYLIQGGDDGTNITELDGIRLAELLTDPQGNYGVTEFINPIARGVNWDASYWPQGHACLLKADIVMPEITTAYKLPLER